MWFYWILENAASRTLWVSWESCISGPVLPCSKCHQTVDRLSDSRTILLLLRYGPLAGIILAEPDIEVRWSCYLARHSPIPPLFLRHRNFTYLHSFRSTCPVFSRHRWLKLGVYSYVLFFWTWTSFHVATGQSVESLWAARGKTSGHKGGQLPRQQVLTPKECCCDVSAPTHHCFKLNNMPYV